jgi:hypothetical protein
MHYIQFVYIYWLFTRVRKRNVSILFKTIENAADVTSTLTLNRHFWVMFNDNFRSNGTSGQNMEYHRLFVWTSSTSHTKQNVSILSTHEDNRCHVTIPLCDLISQYMSFSYVTRPLPVKWHFRSKRHISSCVDMTFPYTYKQTERFYLVYKTRKKVFLVTLPAFACSYII